MFILVDVHARLFAAFARNAGAAHFGQPVVFGGERPEDPVKSLVHFRGRRLRAHADEPQLQIVENAEFFRRFGKVHGIARRGDERRRAEVFEQHDLPLGIARRNGHDGRAQLFDAVMQAETARKQPVPERDVENILVGSARHRQYARDAGRPIVEIGARISAGDGFARRAAGRVYAYDLFHRHGEQFERIVVAKVVLRGIGNFFDVFERSDMFGL